jgi:hypothetical protein
MGNTGIATSFYDQSANSGLASGLVACLREVNQPVPDWLEKYARADFFPFVDDKTTRHEEVDALALDDGAARRNNPTANRPLANPTVVSAADETWG